jgi:hypothetical protein
MHGWSYEHNHSVISFNFNGGLDCGDLLITVPDCDEFVEKIHPMQGVHGPQICLKIPVKAIIQLVFLFHIAPKVVRMFEVDVAAWFSQLTDTLTAWGDRREP